MSLFSISDAPDGSDAGYGADVTTLVLAGEVDYAATPHLRKRMQTAIETGGRRLVLDLSAVTFIDSSAIGVLVGAASRQESAGGSLGIVCGEENQRVQRIFDIAGLASLIALYSTREDARAALGSARPEDLCSAQAHTMAGVSADGPGASAQTTKATASSRYAQAAATMAFGPGPAVDAGAQHMLDQLA